jgi:hypothetical protein
VKYREHFRFGARLWEVFSDAPGFPTGALSGGDPLFQHLQPVVAQASDQVTMV